MSKGKEQCPCPGPLCGDQSYDEMLKTMKNHYQGFGQTESDLVRIHLKWKKIASQL